MDILQALVMQSPAVGKDRDKSIVAKSSDDFFALYPLTYRLMTERKIGKVDRELSKLSIKLAGEGFVTTLTEPASGQVIFSTSDSLLHAFERLEGRLGSEKPDWRPDKYAKSRKVKK